MSRSAWGVVVATLFAIAAWVTPVPERWRVPLVLLAWVALGLACIGWLLAHIRLGQRLRSSRKATRPMTLLLIGLVGGALSIVAWLLVPKLVSQNPVEMGPAPNEEKKVDLSKPELAGFIDQVAMGNSPFVKNRAVVVLTVSIRNGGKASVVEGYDLSLKVPGVGTVVAQRVHAIENIIINRDGGRPPITIDAAENLEDKTARPIPTGGMVRGNLVFFVDGTTKEVMYRANTVLTVTFHDVEDRLYTATYTMTDAKEDPLYFPGMKPPKPYPKKI